MDVPTVTASMADWFTTDWTIKASYSLASIDTPPPPPTAPGELRENPDELYEESLEDLAIAKQASEEYEASGIDDTIPYNEYRARRLGTDS